MVSIYFSSKNTRRLDFIAGHIFNRILGTPFEIIEEKKIFLQRRGICINYSGENMRHGLHIVPQGLLTEKGVQKITDLQPSEWKGLFCFFKQEKGDIPFDLFAASFYLLTLYEEYIPDQLDEHERFHHKDSFAYRNGFLEIPIIDRWAYLLKKELEGKGYDTSFFQLRKYNVISTFDIDHPYLYRNKGLIKNAGGAVKDLLRGRFRKTINRIGVLLHLQPDPFFQSILFIEAFHQQINLAYYLFILIGGKSRYDHSIHYVPHKFYNYLRQVQSVTIGLHPSYHTFRDIKRLTKEKSKLEHILNREINISRQHYLRMQNPETFQELNIVGFQEDFTLSFARAPGFRSGTAIPYPFYDIEKEEETGLLIRPTIMMDSTFIFHQKLKPEEALHKMEQLIDECKKSGGDYLSLWHNSNLAGTRKRNPWIDIFVQSYQYALSLENQ